LNREEIRETLSGVFEGVFDRPIVLRDDMTARDVEEWDSVAHVMLILATEKAFGIRFESVEIANAGTVGEFMSLIEAKQAA
jgi:acyl carrier protein